MTTSINGRIINLRNKSLCNGLIRKRKISGVLMKSPLQPMKCVNLSNLKLYENDNLILSLSAKFRVSDVEITNSGKIVFYDHSEHFLGKLKIHIYSKEGLLFSKEFEGADQLWIFTFRRNDGSSNIRRSFNHFTQLLAVVI